MDTDEISSVLISSQNTIQIMQRNLKPYKSDITVEEPPLPYLLMHAFLKIRNSDAMARLPSAIMGIVGIWIMFLLAKELFGSATGVWASFLLSISFYHIFYSQLARGYAGFILFSMLSLYFLLRYIHNPNTKNIAWLSLANMGGIYFHYAMLQVYVIEAIIMLFTTLSLKKLKQLCIAGVFVFFAIIPLFYSIILTIRGRVEGNTIAFEMNPVYLTNLLCRYGAGNGIAFFIYNIFAVLGLIRISKKTAILSLWFLFPFCFLFLSGYKYFLHIRYFIYIFPVYIIFVAYGISLLAKSTTHKVIIALIFILMNIMPLRLYYSMPAKMTDWKAIAEFIKRKYSSDKVILIESSFCVKELKYYLDKIAPHIQVKSVYGDTDKFLALCRKVDVLYVDNSPVFDKFVSDIFSKRVVLVDPVFKKLGERELIDWDKSWFSQANIRRYYPSIYHN